MLYTSRVNSVCKKQRHKLTYWKGRTFIATYTWTLSPNFLKTTSKRVSEKHTRRWRSCYFLQRLGAWKSIQGFDWKTLGGYHDLNLNTHVLIQAPIFEEFRKACFAIYSLDCVHFYTSSNLSGEAFLKVCNAEIELLTNREHLERAENLIDGKIFCVCKS